MRKQLLGALALASMVIASVIAIGLATAKLAAHRIASEPPAIECIGDREGSRVVYLHGVDSFGPSWQELGNRRTLARLAGTLDLAIAIPRAPDPCWNNPAARCWPSNTAIDAGRTMALIRGAAEHCFGSATNTGVLAFSNGGFAIGAAFHRCQAGELAWIAISGAGSVVGNDTANDLADCGKLAIVIGDGDRHHHHHATEIAAALRARNANVELVEFEGGHRLDLDVLSRVLAPWVDRGERR